MASFLQKHRGLQRIGVGGLSAFVGFGGFAIWFFARRQYRLIFRDELTFLGAPTLFIVAGCVLSILALLCMKRLATFHNRTIKSGLNLHSPDKPLSRGGPLTWLDVWCAVVPGTVLGTIGIGLFINCFFDRSLARTHHPTILKLYTRGGGGARGGQVFYHFRLKDWKKPNSTVTPTLGRDLYGSHNAGDNLKITTKQGSLGYEWVVHAE